MILPLLGILITALILLAVSSATRLVHLDDFVSAILAAMILGIVPVFVAWLIGWSGYQLQGAATAAGLAFLTQVVALGVVALFIQGVSFNGLFGFFMTAAILTAIDWLLPVAVAYVMALVPRTAS
jgi:uncharacterized membrane protein YvlD (DUF360 family)